MDVDQVKDVELRDILAGCAMIGMLAAEAHPRQRPHAGRKAATT